MAATVSKQTISAEGAQHVIAAAEAKARELGVAMSISILDDAGNQKALLRMDGAPLASIGVATDKAYTAVGFGLPTDLWYDAIKDDPPLLHGITSIPRFMMIGGGYPLVSDGEVIGAVGVSGGAYQQDTAVAKAGAESLA